MTVPTESVAGTNQSRAAHKLKELSSRCRREEQVRELARALHRYQAGAGDPDAATGWARVDLFNAFLSEDPTLVSDKAAKRLTRYEIALQVGVFVPIFITWLGLAVAAFSASPGQSMLQSWESSSFLSLHSVAVATAVLVLILIFLTWQVSRWRSAAEAEEDKLRQDLSAALTLAGLELAPLRQGVTEQVALQMGKVEQSLKNVEQSLENTAKRFEGAGRTASRFQETATAEIRELNKAIEASRQATEELGAAPQKLMDPLARLATATWEISSATSESSRLFARAMADASVEIAAATSATSGVVTQALAGPLAALTSATASIADATSASSSEIAASASASSAKIAASLDNQAAEIRTAVDEAVAAAGGYASRTEIVTDILGRWMAEIREVIDEVVAAAGGYASRTEIATDVLGRRMADMPDAVRSLHESLANVDRQLSELTAALVRVPSASEAATRQVASIVSAATGIGGYASRAELTADALGKTHQALTEMPFTVRGLHEGVTGLGGQFTDLAKAVADAREAAGLMLQAASVLRGQAPAQQPDETGHRTGGLFSRGRS